MTLVKPKDLAQTLGVSVDTVYRMAQRGDIPKALRLGDANNSALRFDEVEVLDHLKQKRASTWRWPRG